MWSLKLLNNLSSQKNRKHCDSVNFTKPNKECESLTQLLLLDLFYLMSLWPSFSCPPLDVCDFCWREKTDNWRRTIIRCSSSFSSSSSPVRKKVALDPPKFDTCLYSYVRPSRPALPLGRSALIVLPPSESERSDLMAPLASVWRGRDGWETVTEAEIVMWVVWPLLSILERGKKKTGPHGKGWVI